MSNNCVICRPLGDEDKFVVFQNEEWTVRHSRETNILGYLLIESRRHILDLSEANDAECASYGPLLRSAVTAIKSTIDPERVYTITLAEAVPHFHVHLIPRTNAIPKAYRGRGILAYPLEPRSDEALVSNVCARLTRLMRGAAAPKAPAVRPRA
ncbi:MAG TPA: HIT domain-containing protein [Planktothrix sp.]|jgi:diadenosine tetraphosphate (Ap4A) HIT family hydrolase